MKAKPQKNIVASLILSMIIVGSFYSYLSNPQMKSLKTVYVRSLVEVLEYGNHSLDDLEYIAIDLDSLKGLNDVEKEEIISYFVGEYKLPVIDSSYSELINNGVEKKDEKIKGTVLYAEKIEKQFIFLNVYVAKAYSSLGAYGLVIKFHFKNGEWYFLKAKPTWVA